MKVKKTVFQSAVLIMQFGINMIVPILLCTWIGVYLGDKLRMNWLVIPLFFIGAIAGGQSIYKMSKKIFTQKNGRDTENAKKVE